MFVWRNGDALWLTPQTDHMELVGAVAAAWGSGPILPPLRPRSAVLAARLHDEGWREWEVLPEIDAATGLPLEFRRVSRARHAEFYRRGADFVQRLDAYAGLLVSLHGSGLRLGRYGVDGEAVPERSSLTPEALAYVEGEETRQRALLAQLGLQRSAVWHDYRLLQAWDRIGIFISDGFQAGAVGPVPAAGEPEGRRVSLRRLDELTASVDPYPFAGEAREFPLLMYQLPARRFASDEELQQALEPPARRLVRVRLVRAA